MNSKTSNVDHIFMPEGHMEQLYESNNFFVRYVHRNRLNSIVSEAATQKSSKILDAGCGEGQLLEKFYKKDSKHEYFGIDVTHVAIEKAKTRCPWAKFRIANLASTGYEDNYFDVITCTEVIEHVIEYQVVLAELKRILKPNGFLIITFPNEFLWTVSRFILRRDPVKVPDHVNAFNPAVMKKNMRMELIDQKQLPFNFPFFMSLGSLMKFRK